MTDETLPPLEEVLRKAKRMQGAVYLACHEDVASDISKTLNHLVQYASRPTPSQADGALERICQFAFKHGFSTGHADDINQAFDEILPQIETALTAPKTVEIDDYNEIHDAAYRKFLSHSRKPRGQTITEKDSLDWWVFRETISHYQALTKTNERE